MSVTPSGGWVPAVIAGTTGIGLSQRMQSFVLDPAENPFNVRRARQAAARHAHAEPGAEGRRAVARLRGAGRRRPGPGPAAVLPERGRVRHDAAGGRRGARRSTATRCATRSRRTSRKPGRIMLNDATPPYVRSELARMGYDAGLPRPHHGAGQRDPDRPQARHVLGRLEQPRLGDAGHRLFLELEPPCAQLADAYAQLPSHLSLGLLGQCRRRPASSLVAVSTSRSMPSDGTASS